MYCPNCLNEVDYDGFCSECGVELVFVEDTAILKSDFEEVKRVHDDIDAFNEDADNLNLDSADFYSDDILYSLVRDKVELDSFLNTLDVTRSKLSDFWDSVDELLCDVDRMNYLRRFNFVFGDIDFKTEKTINLIENNIYHIDAIKNKINYFKSTVDLNNTVVEDAEIISSHIDNLIENMDVVKKDLENELNSTKSHEEIRENVELRKELKRNIQETIMSINSFKRLLKQKDEEIKELSRFNPRYSDLDDKAGTCMKNIEECTKILYKYLKMIETIEKSLSSSNKDDNGKRILDL